MSISLVNTYSIIADNTSITQKNQLTEYEKSKNTTTEIKMSNNEYKNKLQKEVKQLSLEIGTCINTKKDNLIGSVVINAKLLKKMKNDPNVEKEYIEMLQGIKSAESIVGSYYNTLGKVTERTSHWYMDENGKLVHFGHVRTENKLDKKLCKQADENAKKLIDKTREKAKEKSYKLQELLDSKKKGEATIITERKAEIILSQKFSEAIDGEIYLNENDMNPILRAISKEEKR